VQPSHHPWSYENTSGAATDASLSITGLGVSTPSLPHVILSFGTAPEYDRSDGAGTHRRGRQVWDGRPSASFYVVLARAKTLRHSPPACPLLERTVYDAGDLNFVVSYDPPTVFLGGHPRDWGSSSWVPRGAVFPKWIAGSRSGPIYHYARTRAFTVVSFATGVVDARGMLKTTGELTIEGLGAEVFEGEYHPPGGIWGFVGTGPPSTGQRPGGFMRGDLGGAVSNGTATSTTATMTGSWVADGPVLSAAPTPRQGVEATTAAIQRAVHLRARRLQP
jgi:hypothetical protein